MNQGNKEGLREVYEEYVSYIYGIVFQMLKNKENAEDITSDFFIRLWDRSASYKGGNGHRGWMATIARNMTIDHIRKYKREELTSILSDTEDGESGQGQSEIKFAIINGVHGENNDFYQNSEVEKTVLQEMLIQDALEQLEEKERTIVHMKIIGEMTFKEISESLQIPMGTVSWRFREAMMKLRRCGYE